MMKQPKPVSPELATSPARKASKSTKPSSQSQAASKKGSAIALSGRDTTAVLRRLDIDPAEVDLMPREPAEILTRCLGSKKGLPRQRILAFAAVSPQPCAVAFINAIRKISARDIKKLSFEAMCVRARVSPVEMLGAILMAAKSMKATESALTAILAHPGVVQATVDTAKVAGPAGYSDRRMLHEAVGFLPSKKGGGIEINFGFGRPPEERDEGDDADAAWDDAFPSLGDQIKTWSSDKHKLLEGGK